VAHPAEDRRRALYDEYLKVPAHLRAEIIGGTLYVTPRPAPRHANATSVLGAELGSPFQLGRGGPGGWWILDEPELHLIELEPMVPDLAGWRVERMPELPDTAYFEIVPDWICEVLSPSTASVDRDKKLPLYAELGVPHVWLVDPVGKAVEAHADPDGGTWRHVRVYPGDGPARIPPFEAVDLDLPAMWSKPRRS
jgi:Uma2 family endonuclease